MIVDKEKFFEVQSQMDYVSYDQGLGYHNYKDIKEIKYFVDNINDPKLCVWAVVERRFIFFSILKIVGESYSNEVTYKDYYNFYSQIIVDSKDVNFISIINNNKYSIDFELGVRLAGFLRPMVFTSSPLSIMIELNIDVNRSRNWKRNLKAATKNCFEFKYITNPTKNDIRTFIKMYSELSEKKKFKSRINEEIISNLLSDSNYCLFFVYKHNLPLAGRIVYIDRLNSYDIFAANSNKARDFKGTTFFMMESIFEFLKSRNVIFFDFGRIGVGRIDSVVEFKLSSGGKVVNYNSSWEYGRNKFLLILLSALKLIQSNGWRY